MTVESLGQVDQYGCTVMSLIDGSYDVVVKEAIKLTFRLVEYLASLKYVFFFATLPRRPASRSRLFPVDIGHILN